MGIRSTVTGLILEGPIRDIVDQALAARSFLTASDLAGIKSAVDELRGGGGGSDTSALEARIAALESELASLKKKQSMTMGAVQASTAQLMGVKTKADGAEATAAQANQHATSAKATAEAAADGVTGVEERLDKLMENMVAGPPAAAAATAKPKKKKKKSKAAAASAAGCKVPGCEGSHRARGYCGKHYQMMKRGTLET